MQKALTQMNIQLANIISDVSGETGLKILRAISEGERDGHELLHSDCHTQSSPSRRIFKWLILINIT
jgi:hypothetical protein